MRSRKVLLVIGILVGAIVITVLSMNNIDIPQDEPVITYREGHKVLGFETYREVKMDISGIQIGGMTILAVVGSLIGYFAILSWMFVAWRVLRVLEKLSDTCDRLLQQKISERQNSETEWASTRGGICSFSRPGVSYNQKGLDKWEPIMLS